MLLEPPVELEKFRINYTLLLCGLILTFALGLQRAFASSISNKNAAALNECAVALAQSGIAIPSQVDRTFKTADEFSLWAAHQFLQGTLISEKEGLYGAGLSAAAILGKKGFFKTREELLRATRTKIVEMTLPEPSKTIALEYLDHRIGLIVERQSPQSSAPKLLGDAGRLIPPTPAPARPLPANGKALPTLKPRQRLAAATDSAMLVHENHQLIREVGIQFFGSQLVEKGELDFSPPSLIAAQKAILDALKAKGIFDDASLDEIAQLNISIFGISGVFLNILDLISELEERVDASNKITTPTRITLRQYLSELSLSVKPPRPSYEN